MPPFEESPGDAKNLLQKLQSAISAGKEISLEGLSLAQKGGRELRSPLNAIFGDRLEKMESALALPMRIYRQTADDDFAPLDFGPGATKNSLQESLKESLKQAVRDAATPGARAGDEIPDRICVFIHGLGSSERTWEIRRTSRTAKEAANIKKGATVQRPSSYAKLLRRDTGHLCFFIRYNTGRHISKNGRDLAELLNRFAKLYPGKLREINLIGHSMGGLVSRSAAYYGDAAGHKWIKYLSRNLLLGSPLLGSHQEQIGKLTTDVLKAIPLPGTRVTAHFLDFRSDGIQDLGYGYLRDEDWDGSPPKSSSRFAWLSKPKTKADDQAARGALKNRRNPVPLLKHTRYYLVIGSLSKDPEGIVGGFLGDGVVNRWSARGAAGRSDENSETYDAPGGGAT
ncbi:MAG: alpha/beta fold hydrolase, partial [Leptospirales bacterium]